MRRNKGIVCLERGERKIRRPYRSYQSVGMVIASGPCHLDMATTSIPAIPHNVPIFLRSLIIVIRNRKMDPRHLSPQIWCTGVRILVSRRSNVKVLSIPHRPTKLARRRSSQQSLIYQRQNRDIASPWSLLSLFCAKKVSPRFERKIV